MRIGRSAVLFAVLAALLFTGAPLAQQAAAPKAPYPTPQGTATENGLAGFAKIMCSGVFVSGRTAT